MEVGEECQRDEIESPTFGSVEARTSPASQGVNPRSTARCIWSPSFAILDVSIEISPEAIRLSFDYRRCYREINRTSSAGLAFFFFSV